MKSSNSKSQAFYSDFVISILIFGVILVMYFTYTTNLSNQDVGLSDDLLTDSKTIVSSLTSEGYPNNWNANNVVRIGFTDNDNRINNEKFGEFMKINYNKSKSLLGTTYEYLLFFVNESGGIRNIEGFCGTGNAEANITFKIDAAYYYRGPGEEEYLKDFMVNEFSADVYREDGTPNVDDLDALINNIDNYGFVVMESPELPTNEFNDFKAAAEPYVLGGGFLMLGGQLLSAQGKTMVGATFKKIAGLSASDRLATVVRQDQFFDFNIRDNIVFTQAYYIESAGATLIDIARFNESDIEFEAILDNKIAIARWEYGSGNVFFLSDFDATYFQGNFLENLKTSIGKWVGANCFPINISNIKRENLVKTERLLIYNGDIVRMVLYLWQ